MQRGEEMVSRGDQIVMEGGGILSGGTGFGEGLFVTGSYNILLIM